MPNRKKWYNSKGKKCKWFENNKKLRCSKYGNLYKNFGQTANDACIAC